MSFINTLNAYERIIYIYIIGIFLWYFTGLQYPLSAFIGGGLGVHAIYLWTKGKVHIPAGVWMWLICIVIFFCLFIATNLNNGASLVLTVGRLIKLFFSTGLLAAFPLVGCLPIRPQVIYKAVCILCVQAVITAPLFVWAAEVKLTGYTSPFVIFDSLLKINPVNYQISFISMEPGRYKMFAPWSPALGFVATQYFFIAKAETNKVLKWLGLLGAVLMVVMSVSRLGLIALPVILIIEAIAQLKEFTLIMSGLLTGATTVLIAIFPWLSEIIKDARDDVNSARSSSSLVRSRLVEIATRRGLDENPLLGHGVVEKGGKIVENMPIGTHQTWAGLLFVNGLFGLLAIAIPYVCTLIYFGLLNKKSKLLKTCFTLSLVMGFYSWGETWESLSFLLLPGLVLQGIGFTKGEINDKK
jgi:hypothetical protein